MKASDLRIGNVIIKDGKPIQVDLSDIMDFKFWSSNEQELSPGRYKPETLTEEWLLKFGFDNLGDFGYGIGEFHMTSTKPLRGKFDYDYAFRVISRKLVKIKHVHQLQNLYHSLTGEELTIKP